MKKFVYVLAGFSVMTILFSAAVRADDSIKEGKWEITSVVDKDSQVKGPLSNPSVLSQQGGNTTMVQNGNTPISAEQGKTYDECITNANPIPDIKEAAKQYTGCLEAQVQENSGSVDYELTCVSSANTVNLKGHIVFIGDNMIGLTSSNIVAGDKISSLEEHLKGKFIGPC